LTCGFVESNLIFRTQEVLHTSQSRSPQEDAMLTFIGTVVTLLGAGITALVAAVVALIL